VCRYGHSYGHGHRIPDMDTRIFISVISYVHQYVRRQLHMSVGFIEHIINCLIVLLVTHRTATPDIPISPAGPYRELLILN
jgi:hypothetical protein